MRSLPSFFIAWIFPILYGIAQTVSLSGHVTAEEGPLPFAHVTLSSGEAFLTDEQGRFFRDSVPIPSTITISFVGYQSTRIPVATDTSDTVFLSIPLVKDYLGLADVVVTASRIQVPRYEAILPVYSLSQDVLERTQAVSLAEGLSFSPGLRVENNCANCGFTQVRMNGLAGPYTQILINSRPVFSALMGVYGLEMIPTAMIDRIEVVRGGGSSLYGGSAIAGTINIITRQPEQDGYGFAVEQQLLAGGAGERVASGYATLSGEDGSTSLGVYSHIRQRDPWDANNDGLTELTRLQQGSVGWNYAYRPQEKQLLQWSGYLISELRRGGSDWELPPHQAAIAEQLQHRVAGTQVSWEAATPSEQFRYALYGAVQHISRQSYYGAGGRILGPTDTLTPDDLLALNAYGDSRDGMAQLGAQFTWLPTSRWLIIAGSDWQANHVRDEMPGYNRQINQEVQVWGNYLQTEWELLPSITLHAGMRADWLHIQGNYRLDTDTFRQQTVLPVLVPRGGIRYRINPAWMVRINYTQGYRGPQAFDEDLHIETVGGAARFIRLSPELRPERSASITSSVQYTRTVGRVQHAVLAEGFLTSLSAPFLIADATELPNGVSVATKINGNGGRVQGINAEWTAAGKKWQWQSGLTWQKAMYDQPETIWSGDADSPDSTVVISSFLRTPQWYGFWSGAIQMAKKWQLQCSGVYTGSMLVSRVADINTEYPELITTPDFLELHASLQHTLTTTNNGQWTLELGVRNLLNAFQQDLPTGVDRDAGFIYGPLRPRSFVISLRFDH